MIKRYMYMGYCDDNDIKIAENDNYISYAFYENMVFVYFETYNDESPEDILFTKVSISLKLFPTGEKWVQMTDIFHYSYPISEEYWERKEKNKQHIYKIAFLKHEDIAKYIYYHYKGQQTFAYRHEKYGAIYMYTNILIIYDELPIEEADYELVGGQWDDEDVLAEYNGDIISDVSIDGKGWEECTC